MPTRRKSRSPRRRSNNPRRRSLSRYTGNKTNVVFRGRVGDAYVGKTFEIFFDFGGWKSGFTGTKVDKDPFWGHDAVFFEHTHPNIPRPIAIPLAWIASRVR